MTGTLRLAVAVVLLAAGTRPDPLPAQSCPEASPAAAEELAHKYAPMLRFGPEERYFPTIPFFLAFVGAGLRDSATIAPLGPGGRISWDSLDQRYQAEVRNVRSQGPRARPTRAAVFYQVRCLVGKQNKQLWGFLRNDPQAYHRLGLDTLYSLGLRNATFSVVVYYFYYVRDAGLEGHAHDIERVAVFTPRAPNLRIAGLADSLRIIVGTGHSATTPNNVLVVLGREAQEFKSPSVLVELGGHSSAADRDDNGGFQLGQDVNWNLSSNVWGTRDAQAISGLGFLGRYQEWMTLPRPEDATVSLNFDPGPRNQADQVSHEKDRRQAMGYRDSLFGQKAPPGPALPPPSPATTVGYALLPVETFRALGGVVDSLHRESSPAIRARLVSRARDIVDGDIAPRLNLSWRFQGFAGADDDRVASSLRVMKRWGDPLESSAKQSHPIIWQHPGYHKSPVDLLKRRLYRPTTTGMQNLGDYLSLLSIGYGEYLGRRASQIQLGITIPVFLKTLALPGVLETSFGKYDNRVLHQDSVKSRLSVGLLYERHYRAILSWWGKAEFVNQRRSVEGDSLASNLSLGAGVSLMPLFFIPDRLPFFAERLRLRLGVRVDTRHWQPSVRRFEVQTLLYVR